MSNLTVDPDESDKDNEQNITINGNFNAEELDEETVTRLKGDAIGDTMYSEKFVLNTLLNISFGWSDALEEDFCSLWDMTMEKQVCEYLIKISFPSIAIDVLEKAHEERFAEIIIGILANICSRDIRVDCEVVDAVLHWLPSNDPLTLVQVVRFIKAVTYLQIHQDRITKIVFDRIIEILNNSTNKELLLITLDTLSKLTLHPKLEEIVNPLIVISALTSYKEIANVGKALFIDATQAAENRRTAFLHFLETTENALSYVEGDVLLHALSIKDELEKLLYDKFCVLFDEFELPSLDLMKFYIDAYVVICTTLRTNYCREVFIALTCATATLITEGTINSEGYVILFAYFLSLTNVEVLERDLRECSSESVTCLRYSLNCEDLGFKNKDKVRKLLRKLNV